MLYDFGDNTNAFKNHIQFEVDDDFFYTKERGYSFYLSSNGYAVFSTEKDGLHNKKLHRILLNEPDGLEVDHADGNPLNNRLENLRVCDRKQNNQNRTKHKDNMSGFKSVSWHKSNKKWQVNINGKHLGCFDSKEKANEYAVLKRRELHGEFARD